MSSFYIPCGEEKKKGEIVVLPINLGAFTTIFLVKRTQSEQNYVRSQPYFYLFIYFF